MKFKLEYGWVDRIRASPPSSKSYAQRALLVASLVNGVSRVEVQEPSDDVRVMAGALRAFGAKIRGATVKGGEPTTPGRPVWCGESGATVRFMTAYASISKGGYAFLYGSGRLHERPIGPLLEAINSLGGWAVSALGNGRPPVIVRGGGIRGGEVVVNASESSQYVSALLMISPLLEGGLRVRAVDMVSRPYVDVTIRVMREFGAEVKANGDEYFVRGSGYAPASFRVPRDASSSAFFIVLGVLSGREALIEGLSPDPPQPDLQPILDALGLLGWSHSFLPEGLLIYPGGGGRGRLSLYLRDSPDLLPPLSVLGLKHPVEIRGVKHARGKESDRIRAMASELSKLGAKVAELEDGLVVSPPQEPVRGASLSGWGDHRVVMALAVADAALQLGSAIDGYEDVSKSFPGFFRELERNGYRVVRDER